MPTNPAIKLVGVDWGTTHRRGYGLDANGHCVAEWADGEGALACKGRFAAALQELMNRLGAKPHTVILSGMVGSALGWQPVPYVEGDVALPDLNHHLYVLDPQALAQQSGTDAGGTGSAQPKVAIVPGYCLRDASGQPDVMRGEETQLLGACCQGYTDGWFVLPGTHSKWVELRGGRVARLRTYMTGELFDLLSRHGTLAASIGIGAATPEAAWDGNAFSLGVKAAQNAGALSHQLFGCRARVVSGGMAASSSQAFLSGLLIGTELHDVLQVGAGKASASQSSSAGGHSGGDDTPLRLIGSPELAAHYQTAADLLGLKFELLDARAAFLSALHHLNPHRSTP